MEEGLIMKLIITKPDGTTRTRVFNTRDEAAEFGVYYYLLDNCHVPAAMADVTASMFATNGLAITGQYTFTEQAE
jgi:hypothetical protein